MTELAVQSKTLLLNVANGELLPATVENALTVLEVAREIEANLRAVKHEATLFLVEESQRQGTKTLNGDGYQIVLAGGESVKYDPTTLRDELEKAGCPEARINECVFAKIEYSVNRSVLRQLVGANPAYAAAAERAKEVVTTPFRASVKRQ